MKFIRRPETVTAALLVLAFVAGILQSPHFLDLRYLLDTSTLHTENALMALGMTLVIVAGQIDLSVGSILALVACLSALAIDQGVPVGFGFALAPLMGAALGWLNGAAVVWGRLPSFVVTLGTMALYRGIAQAMLGPQSVKLPDGAVGIDRIDVGPIPVSLAAALLLAVAFGAILHRSVFGRWVYSVGGGEGSALFAGIPTNRAKLAIFTLSGSMAGLAAAHLNSRLGVARFDHARGAELEVITAVVLGGASIYGGRGTILGTVLAAALLAVLKTGMGLSNVKAEYQLAVIGAMLIVAVVVGNSWRGPKETPA